MLKLWGRVNSINVMKALWCLDELGVPYERVDAGMEHGVVNEPHYRALNPNGRVPTLEHDGFALYESNAIVRYLSTSFGQGSLLPDDAQGRAEADQWMDWQHTTAVPDITFLFWGLIRNKKENQDPAMVAHATAQAGEAWQILDAHLAGRDYVLGDRLTMADIPLGCVAYRYFNIDIERPSLPNLEAWYARLRERPAYQKHVMRFFGTNPDEWQALERACADEGEV